MGRTHRRTTAQWQFREAVLPGTRSRGMLLLRLAQTTPGKGVGPIRFGGKTRGTAGEVGRGACGVGVDDRRASAHRRRGGRSHIACRAGRLACMIHLPASVRVYLCLSPCDMRKYAPSIVMWSRQSTAAESGRFGGSGRRITWSIVLIAALPVACPAGGI